MTVRAKFLFDDDFAAPAPAAAPAEPSVGLEQHRVEVERADQAAFLRGVAEGRRQAESDEAARLASAMQRLGLQFAEVAQHVDETSGRVEADAARLAVATASKLAAALVERHPLVEIEALARSVLGQLRATPHVVVRVEDGLVEAVKGRLERIAREAGFMGTVIVLGEPDMIAGDARVEWADGGTERDSAAIARAIDEAVRRFVSAASTEEARG